MFLKSKNTKIIFKISLLSFIFFLMGVFLATSPTQAACITAAECPEGQSQASGPCPDPHQINCVTTPSGGSDATTPPRSDYGLNEAINGTGLVNTSLSERVGTFISAVVGFVGVIFLLLMVYGGLTWMTAGGNQEKVGKATKIIVNSTIGIIIVMLSYAIVQFIMSKVAS